MNLDFDILQVELRGGPMWIESVQDFATAKARIDELMKKSRCGYIIYSAQTGERFLVKPTDDIGKAVGSGASDGKQEY